MISAVSNITTKCRRGFTLIEMLVVMVIIGILIALVVPAVIGPFAATTLTTTAASLAGDLQVARQDALTRNLNVEIHFYSDGDAIRHYATYRLTEEGEREAIAPAVALPDGIIISEDTTLTKIGTPVPLEDDDLPDSLPTGTSTYSFLFFSDGSTDLDLSEKWFLTMIGDNTEEVPPPNFATIQIGPLTGNVRIHRP